MATIKSSKIIAKTPAKSGSGLTVMTAIADVTTTLASGDLIQFFPVQKGSVVVEAFLDCGDIDTGASPTVSLDLGLAGSGLGDVLIDGSSIGTTGGTARLDATSRGYIVPDDDIVQVTVAATAATAAAGKIAVTLVMSMQPQDAISWS